MHYLIKKIPLDIKKNKLKAGVIFGLSTYWGIIILGTVITFN